MSAPVSPAGLVLLTGGASTRFGAPKHLQAHPAGGSWAARLVDVFGAALGEAPVRILGEPVADRPELPWLDDPRQGPARALACWAAQESVAARRWWLVACDQVHWEPEDLRDWHAAAVAADPEGQAWVMPELHGEPQPLGGFLGGTLLGALAGSTERRLLRLAASLPQRVLPWRAQPFLDVDDRAAADAWLQHRQGGEG